MQIGLGEATAQLHNPYTLSLAGGLRVCVQGAQLYRSEVNRRRGLLPVGATETNLRLGLRTIVEAQNRLHHRTQLAGKMYRALATPIRSPRVIILLQSHTERGLYLSYGS